MAIKFDPREVMELATLHEDVIKEWRITKIREIKHLVSTGMLPQMFMCLFYDFRHKYYRTHGLDNIDFGDVDNRELNLNNLKRFAYSLPGCSPLSVMTTLPVITNDEIIEYIDRSAFIITHETVYHSLVKVYWVHEMIIDDIIMPGYTLEATDALDEFVKTSKDVYDISTLFKKPLILS